MTKNDAPLKPDDFPVRSDKNKILTTSGRPVALAKDEKTADEVAKRLNADEHRQEEDRWSA
ncbi:hypothetical protein [Bradyrhizobium roseum]|uniref:hypothetical protein n=1 Tax=Bradyrhizobium roseum TaxID=3056648 RepID=UPI0026030EB6|nr:hypothetical protein [Bradyrhizobium roseus]WKA29944.1 hypothetical protein QUH67_07165 [Bradyrhizobium roseus]